MMYKKTVNRLLSNEPFLFLVIPFAVFLFPHLFLITGGYERWIMPTPREIGFLENATALFFLLGGIAALYLSSIGGRQKPFSFRLTLIFIGLASVWICLEEISYGQQLLHFNSPEWFLENNYNKEVNLHNLGGDSVSHAMRTAGYIAVALAGIIAPALRKLFKSRLSPGSWLYYFVPTTWMIVPSLFHLLANFPKNAIRFFPGGGIFVEQHGYFGDSGEYEEYMLGLWVILYVAAIYRLQSHRVRDKSTV